MSSGSLHDISARMDGRFLIRQFRLIVIYSHTDLVIVKCAVISAVATQHQGSWFKPRVGWGLSV